MKISGFGEQDTSAWDTLHKGTDRENFDSPSHYELSTLKTRLPHRQRPAPVAPPESVAPSESDDGYEWVVDGESGYWEQTGPSSGYYDTESYLTHEDRQVPEDSAYGRRHSATVDLASSGPDSGYFPQASEAAAGSGYYARVSDAAADSGFYARVSEASADAGYDAAPGAEATQLGRDAGAEEYDDSAAAYQEPSHEVAEPTGRHAIVERTGAPVFGADSARPHAAVETAAPGPRHSSPAVDRHPHRLAEPADHSPARRSGRRRVHEPVAVQGDPSFEPEREAAYAGVAPSPSAGGHARSGRSPEDPYPDLPREDVAPVKPARSRVRPYARTRGRTRSDHNLALEALVSTSDDGRRYRGVRSIEHRRICDLCLDTRSVAEIAAHLHLPLGVVKVLVGDMADIGLVLIHQTDLVLGDRSSREFMERVLQGLRNL
ncbi:MAG TPA: DUF742 domain-containing protein [Amycolatopsis sp.]|nr:DUF742 domain-containing protein [Amycolatopsis sp.]